MIFGDFAIWISFGELLENSGKYNISDGKDDYSYIRHKIKELSHLLSNAQSLLKNKTREVDKYRSIARDFGHQVFVLEKAVMRKIKEYNLND